MKLFMTLLVRNEADIIAENIAYHLSRGVDHILVTDNLSTDATPDLVEPFVRCGKATLMHEPADDYSQSVWVTRMARAAADMGADWIINSDADEIWWPHEGDLKSALGRTPAECGSVIVARSNMLPSRRLDCHPFERLVYRYAFSRNGIGLPLPGKAAHRASLDVQVEMGNHSVTSPTLGPACQSAGLLIFHFPYRSYEQFERKVAMGGAALTRNSVIPHSLLRFWRISYERWRAGELRAWYDALLHSEDPETVKHIESGEVVKDTRLADYMREHEMVGPSPAQPL